MGKSSPTSILLNRPRLNANVPWKESEIERVGAALRELVVEATDGAAVVDDEAEAEIEVPEDVTAVRREEALRVERGTEKVGVDAVVVAEQRIVGARTRVERGDGAEHRERSKRRDRPVAFHQFKSPFVARAPADAPR